MSTNVVSVKDIKREWHLVDVKDQVLGRVATGIARNLMGKNKPNFVPYLDNGDFVVVVNADKVRVTGKKNEQKKYVRHSGYPGGLKVETFDKLISKSPEKILEHAVWGMMPKNAMSKRILMKLKVYAGPNHPHSSQQPKTYTV